MSGLQTSKRCSMAMIVTVRRSSLIRLARLPEKVATAAVEFIYGSLTESPRRVGKPLKLGLAGLHSARRGDYRVIYVSYERSAACACGGISSTKMPSSLHAALTDPAARSRARRSVTVVLYLVPLPKGLAVMSITASEARKSPFR